MGKYRKAVVAVVGAVLLLLKEQFGISLTGAEDAITGTIIAVLTAAGVFTVPNDTDDEVRP